MKNFILLISILFSIVGFSQDKDYQNFSYSELFKMIEEEQDTIFELENAIIAYDKSKDSLFTALDNQFIPNNFSRTDTLIIDKELRFKSVFFAETNSVTGRANFASILNHIKFLKRVRLNNSVFGRVFNCKFNELVYIRENESFPEELNQLKNQRNLVFAEHVFNRCHFKQGVYFFSNHEPEEPTELSFDIYNSIIETNNTEAQGNHTLIRMGHHRGLTFINNTFKGVGNIRFITRTSRSFYVENNNMEQQGLFLIIPKEEVEDLAIKNNSIGKLSSVRLNNDSNEYDIGWNQFNGKIADWENYENYQIRNYIINNVYPYGSDNNANFRKRFTDSLRIRNEHLYKGEIALRSKFLKIYNARHDTESYNLVFNEIKDLETERLEYLYNTNPTFKTFFTWKTNQFLKVFSAYGTEPARAIIYSVYVILFFALVYLFFPNSWDSHGKNRIVDRYNFFFKYMKRKAGIHEVYLEDQKEDLMSYDQFKNNITSSKQKVPKFFTATALPLYKWAISGTKLSANILKRIDIMKGSWQDLPQHKRFWKSILLVGAFLIAILYDIFIKMLNALMLSINTFTTLGFGEIPIKGLPRYLAIIQGFIGWFMLTIFSVSLISQLLN